LAVQRSDRSDVPIAINAPVMLSYFFGRLQFPLFSRWKVARHGQAYEISHHG
jgi:hypothetical protein